VRIDGTSGYDAYRLAGEKPTAAQKEAKAPPSTEPQAGVEVAESARKYIDQALAAQTADSTAVEEARKLIASGQLDTPEAIDRAAQAIVDRGL